MRSLLDSHTNPKPTSDMQNDVSADAEYRNMWNKCLIGA